MPDSIASATARLEAGELTAHDLTSELLSRIESDDGALGCYVRTDPDGALSAARASDARRVAGAPGRPLEGISVGVKDNFLTKGLETTCCSRILEGFVPPYDGTAVARLRAAGAVIPGKLNMDEFAMGSSNERSALGPVRNPWDLTRVPGGSSGGSAAAVAAGLCSGALGTDTGGSIRQPAAMCGVVGLKPTYGRVSRYGVVAFASSLDQVGPLGRTVEDCARLLGVVAGHDPRDSTSSELPVPDYVAACGRGLEGLRVGVPREYFVDGMEPEVEARVREAIDVLRALGAEVVDVTLPHTPYAVAAYYLVATAEASSNLARYDGIRYGRRAEGAGDLAELYARSRAEGFGPEVKRRIMLGTHALSAGYYDAYYLRALKVRSLIRQDFLSAFEGVDAIACPTAPTTAFRLGERLDDPLSMYLGDIFTIPCNLAGLPGISVPCGFSSAGLPVGLQLLGAPFAEETLLAVAAAYEGATEWSARRPPRPSGRDN
jgi:aspartyl-tRNA(Asn)/glutamyl-tRNA(Gln) amidotransferase subunit A